MAKQSDLEARVGELEKEVGRLRDIEAIKQLKAKYWRCADNKLADEIAECFSRDAELDLKGSGSAKGIEDIREYFRTRSRGASNTTITIHQGHNAEIDITGPAAARGVWQLFYYFIDTETNRGMRLGTYYHDEYVKEVGGWKIKTSRSTPIFREVFDRSGLTLV